MKDKAWIRGTWVWSVAAAGLSLDTHLDFKSALSSVAGLVFHHGSGPSLHRICAVCMKIAPLQRFSSSWGREKGRRHHPGTLHPRVPLVMKWDNFHAPMGLWGTGLVREEPGLYLTEQDALHPVMKALTGHSYPWIHLDGKTIALRSAAATSGSSPKGKMRTKCLFFFSTQRILSACFQRG